MHTEKEDRRIADDWVLQGNDKILLIQMWESIRMDKNGKISFYINICEARNPI
jgi:hypothetical protein